MRIRLTVAAVVVAGALVAPVAAGADTTTFDARASAYGAQATLFNASLPLALVIEGSAPVARSVLTSLDDSQALAAGPYPGDVVASLPGTLGGAFGVPLPSYPLVVATSLGDPPEDLESPGLSLHAASTAKQATARAVIGTGGVGARTETTITRADDGTVTARAVTDVSLLSVLDRVHVGRVRSLAATTLGPDGKRSSTAELRVDGIEAAGLRVELPAATPPQLIVPIPIPGIPQIPNLPLPSVPLPIGTLVGPTVGFVNGVFVIQLEVAGIDQEIPVPTAPILAAFKALGIDMSFQAAKETTTGITAPTLTLSTVLPAIPDNPVVRGTTEVHLLFGAASTSVSGRALASAPAAEVPAGTSSDAVFPIPAGVESGVPWTTPDLPLPGVTEIVAPTRAPETGPIGSLDSPDIADLYPLFAVAGVFLFLSQSLVRVLGVRRAWSS